MPTDPSRCVIVLEAALEDFGENPIVNPLLKSLMAGRPGTKIFFWQGLPLTPGTEPIEDPGQDLSIVVSWTSPARMRRFYWNERLHLAPKCLGNICVSSFHAPICTRPLHLAKFSDRLLVGKVADGLGMDVPPALPLIGSPLKPEVKVSPALSLFARPGDGGVTTRKVAILIAAGVDGEGARAIQSSLMDEGAVPVLVAARLGHIESSTGTPLEADGTLETMASCTFDAVVIPDGPKAIQALSELGHAVDFVKDQYRHCKAILAVGVGKELLAKAGIPTKGQDPALLLTPSGGNQSAVDLFIIAVAQHRNWERATDPPHI